MSGEVRFCGGCASDELTPLLDMGFQPLAEGGGKGTYPLRLVRCGNCSLVQLSYIPEPADVFRPEHPYSTGNSAALVAHYQELTRALTHPLHIGDVVVDIGANDGTLLNCYPPGRGNLAKIAVEPTGQGLKCGPDVMLYQEFFTAELAHKIAEVHGPAKVVTACNVLAHVPDVHDFLDGVTALLDSDGVFVTENHDLYSVTDGLQIDTIYHEHLRYYSLASLARLLEAHGLRIAGTEQVPTHGGSFRVTARRQSARSFQARARIAATALRGMLWKITQVEHKTVYGIGASTRATPLIHYTGIRDFITCVCEVAGSDKIGTNMPGTVIPVVGESRLFREPPDYALLFAWHMADVIIPKLRERGYQGKFIVPLPEPKVLDD